MVTAIIPSLLFFVHMNSTRGGEALGHVQALVSMTHEAWMHRFDSTSKVCVETKNDIFRFTSSRKVSFQLKRFSLSYC